MKGFNIFYKVIICIATAGITLYTYMNKQNEVTELRLMIPALSKSVKQLQEENIRMKYELEQFESPVHLMEIARKPEFGHMKYPFLDEVIVLEETN